MKKKPRGFGTKKRLFRRRPIVQYVVNANPPQQVVWLNKGSEYVGDETLYAAPDLRILMVLDQFNVGGTETHVLTCTRELLRRGIHVVVAAKKGEMSGAFAALGCPVYELNFVTNDFLRNDADITEIVTQLKQIMNAEGITVVHIHQPPSGMFAAIAAEQLCVPCVFTVHMNDNQVLNDLELLKKSNKIICVSPTIFNRLPVKGLSAELIPNGVDPVQFDYRPFVQRAIRSDLGIPETAPVIMYVGRLSWEKAEICHDLIEACVQLKAERYPDLHVLIVGEGKQSDRIKSMARVVHDQSESEFIHVWGNSLNMTGLYSICDCFVGTGRAALEALACRRPVVAIGVKGFFGQVRPDNYQHAWDTWFGDHHADEAWDVEKIKRSIEQVLDKPEVQKMESGWVSRNYVKERFHIVRTTNALVAIYTNLLKDRSSSYGVK